MEKEAPTVNAQNKRVYPEGGKNQDRMHAGRRYITARHKKSQQ
jgi:hypothetical protein